MSDGGKDLNESDRDSHKSEIIEVIEPAASNNTNEH